MGPETLRDTLAHLKQVSSNSVPSHNSTLGIHTQRPKRKSNSAQQRICIQIAEQQMKRFFRLILACLWAMPPSYTFVDLATAAPAKLANPIWISADDEVFQVGLVASSGALRYGVLGRDGNLSSADLNTLRKLAVLYERASVGYLDPEQLDNLTALRGAITDVQERNLQIIFLNKLQNEAIHLGVQGVFVYFTGGSMALNSMSKVALDELSAAVVDAPRNVARGWAHGLIANSKIATDQLIENVKRRKTNKLGESAASPLAEEFIQSNFEIALFVDIYAIPSSELLVSLQPKSDLTSQLRNAVGVIGESSLEAALPVTKAIAAKNLINAGKLINALEQGVPEMTDYRSKVSNKVAKWRGSAAGIDLDIEKTPLFQNVAFEPSANNTILPDASFDCDLARTRVEKAICASGLSRALDKEMADIYTELRTAFSTMDRRSLKSDQRKWLKSRNRCDKEKDIKYCLVKATTSRIDTLKSYRLLISYFPDARLSDVLDQAIWSALLSKATRHRCEIPEEGLKVHHRIKEANCRLPLDAVLRQGLRETDGRVLGLFFATAGDTVYVVLPNEYVGASITYVATMLAITRDGTTIVGHSGGAFRSSFRFEKHLGQSVDVLQLADHDGSRVQTETWLHQHYRFYEDRVELLSSIISRNP